MADEKDRFGDTMRLLERAKEDVYFAERDREILNKLRQQFKKVETKGKELHCPKCSGLLETYVFRGINLERCQGCEGIWLDKGELEAVIRKISRGPLGEWVDKLTGKEE